MYRKTTEKIKKSSVKKPAGKRAAAAAVRTARPPLGQEYKPGEKDLGVLAQKSRAAVNQTVRGMHDRLPAEEPFWNLLESRALEMMSSFGYGRVETPILEEKSLFVRGLGDFTDVVQKEMYCFKDQGGEEVCLRPEATASVARAYINHGMLNLPQPVKLWYWGPFFRRERPQAGRFRQFHQWGIEILGDAHPVLDAEVISIALAFFKEVNLPVRLEINSIGCNDCRPAYVQTLTDFYGQKRELLCGSCKVRIEHNPLRLLDCKEVQCALLKEGAPQIVDTLCEACRGHFMQVLEYLEELSISYEVNAYLVRGLDYYSRTVFEIFPGEGKEVRGGKEVSGKDEGQADGGGEAGKAGADEKASEEPEKLMGAQSALGSGGRYDGLVEYLGGRPTPAVGFAVGLERVVACLRRRGDPPAPKYAPRIFIAQLGEAARRRAFALWHDLRAQIPVAVSFSKDGLKAQLEIANRLGVRYAVIIGQKEIIDKTAIIRDMEAGMQEVVDYNKIVSAIKKKLE